MFTGFFFFFYIATRSSLSQLPRVGERREARGISQKQRGNALQLSRESAWFWKPRNLLGKAEEGFPETREKCFCK
jgi:hypothetical protein